MLKRIHFWISNLFRPLLLAYRRPISKQFIYENWTMLMKTYSLYSSFRTQQYLKGAFSEVLSLWFTWIVYFMAPKVTFLRAVMKWNTESHNILKRTDVKNFPSDHQFCNKTYLLCFKSWLNPNQLLLISRILSFVPFSQQSK